MAISTTALANAIQLLPEGISSFLMTPLNFTAIDAPSDRDGSIIASGQAMASLHNGFLVPFGGLTLIDLLLRSGQYNTLLQAMAVAGIEVPDVRDGFENTAEIVEAFRESLFALPEALQNLLTTQLPEFPELSLPSEVEAAEITIGKANAYLTQALAAFNGVLPVLLFLKSGNFNPALATGLWGQIECKRPQMAIVPIKPTEGEVFYGFLDEFKCKVADATTVFVEMGEDTFELHNFEGEPNVWQELWAVPIGQHIARFTATYQATNEGEEPTTETLDIHFEVKPWETFPVDGETYRPEEVNKIEIIEPRADVCTVHAYDGSYVMEKDADGKWVTVDFFPTGNPGTGIAIMLFELLFGDETKQFEVQFTVSDDNE